MSERALLGFDYGETLIGVAVGHTLTGMAQPLATIEHGKTGIDWDQLARLIQEWRPDALVVGLPRNMDDSDNARTVAARKFGNRLQGRYNLPVYMVDERLTTHSARLLLSSAGHKNKRGNKAMLDKLAAQLILQSYLDDPSGSQV